MLKGVNPNYIVVALVTGAVLLAAIYHTILYSHRKTKLLASYSVYLWATFLYCLFRAVLYSPLYDAFRYFNADETFQMISFVMYIRFAGFALDLDKIKEKYAVFFVERTPYVVFFYLFINTILVNVSSEYTTAYFVFKISIRAYLLLLGLLMLLTVVRKRSSVFYTYLAAGAISMIAFGLISSVINIAGPPEQFFFGAISWLMFGFFLDVVFFSAAIGYRIRQEYNERENSLKTLMQKEAELQQKELEKMKAVYETREEERMRIARDLHDDMGSTLSSISIYSKVAAEYLNNDPVKVNDLLEKIQENTKQLMESTSDLIWSLQTNYGQAESIFIRMQKTAIEMLSSANISPRLRINDQRDLPLLHISAQKNCWLIFKEALNNVCKYSQANHCEITISTENKSLVMKISDDGIGFEKPKNGNGLLNMKQRATEFKGICNCRSSPGKGTELVVILPVDQISIA